MGDVVLFTNWAGDEFKQSRGDDDPGGVRIGVASDALTQVQVGAGSQLTAAHVQLNATVNGSGGSSHSEGSASAAGADS